jgi:type IV secretory pathway component VirB8
LFGSNTTINLIIQEEEEEEEEDMIVMMITYSFLVNLNLENVISNSFNFLVTLF